MPTATMGPSYTISHYTLTEILSVLTDTRYRMHREDMGTEEISNVIQHLTELTENTKC